MLTHPPYDMPGRQGRLLRDISNNNKGRTKRTAQLSKLSTRCPVPAIIPLPHGNQQQCPLATTGYILSQPFVSTCLVQLQPRIEQDLHRATRSSSATEQAAYSEHGVRAQAKTLREANLLLKTATHKTPAVAVTIPKVRHKHNNILPPYIWNNANLHPI